MILLREVKDGKEAGGQGQALRQALEQLYGQAALDAMVGSLRRAADVQVFNERL